MMELNGCQPVEIKVLGEVWFCFGEAGDGLAYVERIKTVMTLCFQAPTHLASVTQLAIPTMSEEESSPRSKCPRRSPL